MKKTLVAIAALTLVGAAAAQSSVTLYGRIDAAIGSQKTTVGGATTVDGGALVLAGSHTGNRWGLRGSEDLGGGLKAIFQLEQGFTVDDGGFANATRQFHRQAYVGVSGGFGSLTVGRQYDLLDVVYGNYDAFGYSGYGAMNYSFNRGTGGDIIGRQNNSVLYTSPNLGGFTVAGMWAPGENKVPGVTSAGNNYGLMANYANGPVGIGAVWQSNKATGGIRATTNGMIGGSYDLGVAKLYAQYQETNNKPANSKDDGFQIGAVIPLGAPSLMVSYATEDTKTAGAKTQESSALSLMVQYPLSKRTYVYAAYLNGEVDPTAVGAPTTKNRNFGLGLVHNF